MSKSHIVIFRLGSMGDTIVALPCFHAVRKAYPSANITLLTNFPVSAKAAPMFELLGVETGIVNNAISYSVGLEKPLEAIKLLYKIRSLKATTLIYMRSGPTRWMIFRDKIFFHLAGFQNILCIPKQKNQRVSRINPITLEVEPESKRLVRCFSQFAPISLSDRHNWDLRLSQAELSKAEQIARTIPSPFLVVHTGGKAHQKDWGFSNWIKFLQLFRQQSNAVGLAIVGSQDDFERAEALAKSWGDGAVNLCGGPSPRVVCALLSLANLFIGHDSGPLHLAQCSDSYALGLFGSYNKPKQWHPISPRIQIIHEEMGIKHININQVLTKALKAWNRS